MKKRYENLQLFKENIFSDERGVFAPLSLITSCEPTLSNSSWFQSNISVNPKAFTLRGLHFQKYPFAQAKLIKVITGSIIDFVVDIEPESPLFLKVNIFSMNPGDELYVPKNYAHGFLTLQENTIVQYLVDNIYNPESEGVIPWTKFPELNEKFNSIENFSSEKIIVKERDLVLKNFDPINFA
jgi:dTDP-4-dehydrorhamnose 3,5-epimerase